MTSKGNKLTAEAIQSPEQTIAYLAQLSEIEYEQLREGEAKRLKFRVSVLDNLVADVRAKNKSVMTSDQPYAGAVDGSLLLDEISEIINKHMILPKGALPAITLWVVLTYVFNAFKICPKLAIISPEKRCGKSTLLDLLGGLSHKSLLSSNITPSALFRAVDLWQPTLLIDEADTFLAGRNDDLIGMINSGHTKRTAVVIRVAGDDLQPKQFSTWSPMAFASIKGLTSTVMDRSIRIHLRRRKEHEAVQKTSLDFWDDCQPIRQKLTRWGQDHFESLKSQLVEPPAIANDRAMDNWTPLFTIAGVIGGSWPEEVQSAYELLNQQGDEQTPAVRLLQDIQTIFTQQQCERLHSVDLVRYLVAIDESPWHEWKNGQPITASQMAKMLSAFGIRSKTLRAGVPEKRLKGYTLAQFQDAFSRYLPTQSLSGLLKDVTALQACVNQPSSDIQKVTNPKGVTPVQSF